MQAPANFSAGNRSCSAPKPTGARTRLAHWSAAHQARPPKPETKVSRLRDCRSLVNVTRSSPWRDGQELHATTDRECVEDSVDNIHDRWVRSTRRQCSGLNHGRPSSDDTETARVNVRRRTDDVSNIWPGAQPSRERAGVRGRAPIWRSCPCRHCKKA
jgi:hypothetical protein